MMCNAKSPLLQKCPRLIWRIIVQSASTSPLTNHSRSITAMATRLRLRRILSLWLQTCLRLSAECGRVYRNRLAYRNQLAWAPAAHPHLALVIVPPTKNCLISFKIFFPQYHILHFDFHLLAMVIQLWLFQIQLWIWCLVFFWSI